MDINLEEFSNAYNLAWEESGRRAQELFGNRMSLPEDESAIVWDDKLYPTHEDKLIALRVLRAGKQVKHKGFGKRITRAGRISARGMGIRLD